MKRSTFWIVLFTCSLSVIVGEKIACDFVFSKLADSSIPDFGEFVRWINACHREPAIKSALSAVALLTFFIFNANMIKNVFLIIAVTWFTTCVAGGLAGIWYFYKLP